MNSADDTQRSQPDKDEAEKLRPVPSQAEGDRETVEEDLKEKAKDQTKLATNPLYKPSK